MEEKSASTQFPGAYPGFLRLPRLRVDEAKGDSRQRRVRLETLLRSEILPRLTNLHPSWLMQAGTKAAAPEVSDIETFAALIISPDEKGVIHFLRRMQARGYDFETLV